MTVLAVFKSRTETQDFMARMRGYGVAVNATSTPRSVGVGCGLSAKFDERFMPVARRVIGVHYATFVGFMPSNDKRFSC